MITRTGLALVAACVMAGLMGLAPVPASAQMLVPAPPRPDDRANRSAPTDPSARLSRPLAPGEQLVVVRGFRIREAAFDTRPQALHAGLMSAAASNDCETTSCGFVVFEVAGQFRYTSLVVGTESELTGMAADLEREGLALVIVYPPASRLRRYYTPAENGMVAVSPDLATIGKPLPSRSETAEPRRRGDDDTGGW